MKKEINKKNIVSSEKVDTEKDVSRREFLTTSTGTVAALLHWPQALQLA